MRSRSNSGVRLDKLMHLAYCTVLDRMDPITGLFQSNYPGFQNHAWIRDNVYALHCVWGLALAYRKNADFDEDVAKVYELEQTCVKVMRSLLTCMMRQVDKIEKFKKSQAPQDSLHAKYSARTMGTVVGDRDWGHLQIDAISLYLLTLAQMTASGLQIIYNLDEVAFIQNLVFYIENAYRIPDFGVWERGDKTNHGLPELNASSIGMAKAALESLNDLDLFGAHGSKASVIHVLADEMQQCSAILQSMLPRESYSKETDAALLSVISYPAFAVEDPALISLTRAEIIQKLKGRYGCRRFLRDGYKTAVEVDEYKYLLEDVLMKGDHGIRLVPELYTVPRDKVELEYMKPGSEDRSPAGSIPYLWAQSLYILVELADQGFIKPAELDPLNRRFATEKRPDTVVQVVVLAEDHEVKHRLAMHKIHVETVEEVKPFTVLPASALGKIYAQLGRNEKMNLSGRQSGEVGLLSTSKLYTIDDRFFVFTPQSAEDGGFMGVVWSCSEEWTNILEREVEFLKLAWRSVGLPVLLILVHHALIELDTPGRSDELDGAKVPMGVIGTLKKLKSGYLSGTRVALGRLEDFLTTSCITNLDFLCSADLEGIDDETKTLLDEIFFRNGTDKEKANLPGSASRVGIKRLDSSTISRGKVSVFRNMSTRHRSIMLDANDAGPMSNRDAYERDLQKLRLRYSQSSPVKRKQSWRRGSDVSAITTPESLDYGVPMSDTPELKISSGEVTPTSGRAQSPYVPSEEEEEPFEALQLLRTTESTIDSAELKPVSSRLVLESLEDLDAQDLVDMLCETEIIDEQGDLVYCLWLKKGPDYDTVLFGKTGTTVRKLVEELYVKACHSHTWWLVRLCSGLLEKRVEDLAKAVTDLLVRQKQVTVGMPAIREEAIVRPLPPEKLQQIIKEVFGHDINSVVLTQEILVYLGMFVRTEPQLFREMLRLRIGLIIQVMASELARALHKTVDEASEHLLNISPFEMKTLLHHILSGKEVEDSRPSASYMSSNLNKSATCKDDPSAQCVSTSGMPVHSYTVELAVELGQSKLTEIRRFVHGEKSETKKKKLRKSMPVRPEEEDLTEDSDDEDSEDSSGQWVRRRRIDGALNRVPPEFYSKIWKVLKSCEGLSIEGHVLHRNLTKEMTTEEIKFAVTVESALNRIPEPEYRQLLVEALMVLTIVVENQTNAKLNTNGPVNIEKIVHKANDLFIQDQKKEHGDAISCCAGNPPISCGGESNICKHFYDMPPSGRYGTITYMCRAVSCLVPHDGEDIECSVQ